MPISLFQLHVLDWEDCTRCSLSATRKRTVLAKGKLPCDILFVGEAPGDSEDVCGVPFKGPAGDLLHKIINCTEGIEKYRLAFTNVLACIPKDERGNKVENPEKCKGAIEACNPRLEEILAIACPRLVVFVGKIAAKHTPTWGSQVTCELTHPAAILKGNPSARPITIKRNIVTLSTAVRRLEDGT